jgi:hypothetical protein
LAASFPASRVSRLCRRWVLRVSSNPHPSAPQVANPRVSPRFQLSCLASQCRLQVSLNSASSGSTGDGSSSFLESRILQRCLPLNLRVSPALHLSASPCDELSGFPELSSSGCRRWFLEFPQVPHPSALPSSNLRVSPALLLKHRLSMIPRVSPVPRSSGCAGDGSSSFHESRILQRYWRRKAPGFPESSLLQHRLSMSLRVSPDTASSGCADGEFPGIPGSRSIGCAVWSVSGSPRLPHPPAAPSMRTQASLNPAQTVGSMMTPHLNRTLHPRARPRMNLRLNQVLHILV